MELISFGKKTQPVQPSELSRKIFGIINLGSLSNILVGPYDNENVAEEKLILEVEILMGNPATELIVNEDSANIYEQIDNNLIIIKKIDIASFLETEED